MAARKRTSKVVTETMLTAFNIMRESNQGKTFNRIEMQEKLSTIGVPKHNSILKAFSDGVNPPIVRVDRGVYRFAKQPVYKDRLQLALDSYTKMANPGCYKDGKYSRRMTEEECIQFLKDTGKYEIYRVIRKLEKI